MTEIFELIDANDAQGVLALLARVPEQAAARDEEDLTAVRRAAYRSPELLDAVTSANPPLDGFDAATSRGSSASGRCNTAAAFGGDVEVARVLLEHGADPNGRAVDGGFTALHSAAQGGNRELIELLLVHGADPRARTDDGRLPMDLAANDETAALLRA